MKDDRKGVLIKLTLDQFNLARRKLYVEDLSWQKVGCALINAYIMGDISVTKEGKYKLAPPTSKVPVIRIEEDEDEVEIEPDWGVQSSKPQIGASDYESPEASPEVWGTRELIDHLRSVTGRRFTLPMLRTLLNHLGIEKAANRRWRFEGAYDNRVIDIEEAIENGVYDALVRHSTTIAENHKLRKQSQLDEVTKAQEITERERKLKHLRKLRQIEES